MKKLFVLFFVAAFALASCDALVVAPTAAPLEPTPIAPTAQVIVVTVEVPVEVTVPVTSVPPTAAPMETQVPASQAPTEVPPSEAAPSEAAPAAASPTQAAPTASGDSSGPVVVDASFMGNSFQEISYSSPSFSLRCQPTQITFDATVKDPAITAVDFYYRIEDRVGTTISEWKNQGRMQVTGAGTFSLTLSGETIHPDLRKQLAWFDFQLVGLNKFGAAVGRTEKIVQLVTYTIDCQ